MTDGFDHLSGEYTSSLERELDLERHQKIESFIREVIKPADKTLHEQKVQNETIQGFESRPYQLEAWDALWRAREEGKDRGLIHLATGLGKTSVAVFDYARFRKEQEEKGESARALFVVHQNAILEQADERFNEVLPHLLPGVGMSRFSNQASVLPTGEVVFASFQSLNRGVDRFPPDYFDYIVYDEAHHIEAKTYKKVVEYFTPRFQLGLTATPERGDGKDITAHFGEALYTKTLPEGIAEEYLADVHYRLMLDGETKRQLQSGFKPQNLTELNKLFNVIPNPEGVAEAIKAAQQEVRDRTGLEKIKTIIFSSDIAAADEMARLMGGEGYHSGIGSERGKRAVLDAFRNGQLETIVTRDMFNEGVDIPDARLIVFFRSTQSKTIFEQQLGRGLRRADGKHEVMVLDFVANAERIRLVRELAGEVGKGKSHGSGHGGSKDGQSDVDGGLIIGIGKSSFAFDQQIIDILALYDYFREKQENKAAWSTWSNEDLVVLAKELSPRQPLKTPDMILLSKQGRFTSVDAIVERFGSVPNFQRACGFEVVEKRDWTQYSKDAIVELAKSIDPHAALSNAEIVELSKEGYLPSVKFIKTLFGSKEEFDKACGFERKERVDWSKWTNEAVVGLAKKLSPDEPMSAKVVKSFAENNQFPSYNTINNRFGSLQNFHNACGFEPVTVRPNWESTSNEAIIQLARSLYPEGTFTVKVIADLARGGEFPSINTIAKRFGSLSEFQRLSNTKSN